MSEPKALPSHTTVGESLMPKANGIDAPPRMMQSIAIFIMLPFTRADYTMLPKGMLAVHAMLVYREGSTKQLRQRASYT